MAINVRIRNGMCPDLTTGEGGATEGDIRGSFSDIIDVIGVKDLAGGHCAVTQNSPAAMSVLVAPGIVYIPNADYDELDSNEPRFYEAIIDTEEEVEITKNTSVKPPFGLTRIDLVCVKIDKTITPDEHASNIATLVAVAGTPGAGTPATPDNHYVLATVAVANGASTIVNANITSTRVQSKIDFDFLPKATGAEINTGTEDAKIVTPKAIADSYLANGYSSIHRQAIINGNFDVWQRGTSFSLLHGGTNDIYTTDRWKAYCGEVLGQATISQQIFTLGQTDVPNNPKYFMRFQQTANGSTYNPIFYQRIEGVQNFAGGKVTTSIWLKVASGTLTVTPLIRQKFGTGGSPSAEVITTGANYTVTTTWTKFTTTFTIPSISGKTLGSDNNNGLDLAFSLPTGATFTLDIAQVQLCAGDVALPFMPKSYDDELRACCRYWKIGQLLGIANTTSILAISSDFALNPLRTAITTSNFKIYTTKANAIAEVAQQALTTPGVGDTNITQSSYIVNELNGVIGLQLSGTPLTAGRAYSGYYVINQEL